MKQTNEAETIVSVVDYDKIAADIRTMPAASAVPFLAGIIIAGLMILPDNLQPSIYSIKLHNPTIDNYEILCVFFARNDKLRNDFLEQSAKYAENGVFPEGPDQEGWNSKEFDTAIGLLQLTLKR